MSKFPDWSDWYARKPSGTTKKTASQRRPGASSRYGVSCRCRWRKPTGCLAGDQVLPGGQILLVVECVGVEDLHAVQHLLRREDERVIRDGWVVLLRPLAGACDRWDVVDAGDVPLWIPGLHQALDLGVVDIVHVDARRVDVAALRDQHVVRPQSAAVLRNVPVDVLVAELRDVPRPRHRRREI